jgi:hypothetical protein
METAIAGLEKQFETCEFRIMYQLDYAICDARDGQRRALFTYDFRFAAPLVSGAVG